MTTPLNIRPLLDAVKTRLTALLTGQTFTVKGGVPAPVSIHLYRLPNSAMADGEERLCPYAVILPMGGTDSLQTGSVRVRVIACCYSEGTDGQGDGQLETIAAAILRLSEQQDFNPHYLDDKLEFIFGDPENGAQNHPRYFLAVDLTFVREPVYLNE